MQNEQTQPPDLDRETRRNKVFGTLAPDPTHPSPSKNGSLLGSDYTGDDGIVLL